MSNVPVKVPGDLRFAQLSTYGRHTCGSPSTARRTAGATTAGDRSAAARTSVRARRRWRSRQSDLPLDQRRQPTTRAASRPTTSRTAGATTIGVSRHRTAHRVEHRRRCSGAALAFATITVGSGFTCGVATRMARPTAGARTASARPATDRRSTTATCSSARRSRWWADQTFKSVSLGNQYACGVTQAGQAYCWGSNNTKFGRWADERFVVAGRGRRRPRLPVDFRRCAHACGVTNTNAVYCWGRTATVSSGSRPRTAVTRAILRYAPAET